MSILRHREVQVFLVVLVLLSSIFIIAGFLISTLAGVLLTITTSSLCLAFLVFTVHRFSQVRRLSDYLRRLSTGAPSLDIRDNTEGELSILKSELYKVTLMLSEYNDRLQREKLLLSNQMADISHQLKTPLTSMLMMVELLQDEQLLLPKRREFTAHLRTQLERIEWLVLSLLKMSKLDAGVVEMKVTAVPIQTLLDNALRPMLIPLEVKEISCCVNHAGQVINCDLQWTTEAIINILKNCIEHTPRGGRIDMAVQHNPLYVEISIADNGTGIDKRDLPHIFTRFYRGKNASPDSIGIGLALSKSILHSQQGGITVESKLGFGSTFFIRFYKSVV